VREYLWSQITEGNAWLKYALASRVPKTVRAAAMCCLRGSVCGIGSDGRTVGTCWTDLSLAFLCVCVLFIFHLNTILTDASGGSIRSVCFVCRQRTSSHQRLVLVNCESSKQSMFLRKLETLESMPVFFFFFDTGKYLWVRWLRKVWPRGPGGINSNCCTVTRACVGLAVLFFFFFSRTVRNIHWLLRYACIRIDRQRWLRLQALHQF
jgi:hypothetical protein